MPIKKVLYLVSDGTQYIDTGIIGKPGIDVELCVAFTESFSGWHFLIGSCYSNSNRSYLIGVSSLTTTTVQRGTHASHDDSYNFTIGTDYVLNFTGTVFSINGSQICTVSDQSFTSPVSMYLFAANKNGEAWFLTPMALKYCKIWEDGILVRDFVPALNDSNVAGLYDNKNNIFYESESGSFDYEVIPWSMGEDGYPTPANSEAVLPDYTFVKPLPRLLWHCSEPTKDVFNALPNKALTEPLPDGMWRITKYVENGYPYNNLMPDLQYAEPVYKYEAIRLLDNVRVVSYPHGLNRLFPVTKMEIPLDKPENTTYTLNFKKSNTLTGNIAKTNMDTWRQLREQPTLTTMLATAQANATQLINNAMGGYVTMVHDENGIVTEIVIADEADYHTAQHIWRWNMGGLGYSDNGYEGPYKAAIDMSGAICADFITAGAMHADHIHGGILTMGGVDNVNGIIQVRKGNGDLACKFDKDGGWIHGRLYTEDDNDNWMNVIDGYIYGGNGDNTYATIDIANEYDIGESDTRGLGFIAPIIGLNCKHLLISDNGRDLYKAKTQTVRVVSDISVDSDGKVTSITKKDLQFKNGILVSVDNV